MLLKLSCGLLQAPERALCVLVASFKWYTLPQYSISLHRTFRTSLRWV